MNTTEVLHKLRAAYDQAVLLRTRLQHEQDRTLAGCTLSFFAFELEANAEAACREFGLEMSQIPSTCGEQLQKEGCPAVGMKPPCSDDELEAIAAAHMEHRTQSGFSVAVVRATIDRLVAEQYLPIGLLFERKLNEPVEAITLADLICKLRQLQKADDEAQLMQNTAEDKNLPDMGFVLASRVVVRNQGTAACGLLGYNFAPLGAMLQHCDAEVSYELEPMIDVIATQIAKQSRMDWAVVSSAIMLYLQALCEAAVAAADNMKRIVPEAVPTPPPQPADGQHGS